MSKKVFISYSRQDLTWVKTLVEALEQAGFEVWFDQEIIPGDRFDQVIENAIRDSDKVLVVWSKNSIESQWVRAEAGLGNERGILVPVLKDSVDVPLQFTHVQSANLVNWNGNTNDGEFLKVIAALSNLTTSVGSEGLGTAKTDADRFGISATLEEFKTRTSYFRIALKIGFDEYKIEYTPTFYDQYKMLLKVDGEVVIRFNEVTPSPYYQFFINHEGREVPCELKLVRPKGNGPKQFFNRIVLIVNGHVALNEAFETTDWEWVRYIFDWIITGFVLLIVISIVAGILSR